MTDLSSTKLPLANFRTALASPRAEKRIDALISADDAAEQVAALSVTDLFFLIDEVGLADCVELLSLCTNQQIRGCIDMEIWDRDMPQIEALLPWLATIQENGFEFLGRVWSGLDQELAALTLASLCNIYDKSLGEEVPDEEERDYFETPDTFFQIVLINEDQAQDKLVHSIIEDLYRADMQMARHTIMSARSEPKAELEEMSYRWRSGRMADLGYVEFYEALEVFRLLDPSSIKIGEDTAGELEAAVIADETPLVSVLPVVVIDSVVGRSFFVQALEQIQDETTVANLQSALLFLVNRVMSAGRLQPGQSEALKLAALHATATVALGLEYVSDGSVDKASEALRSISMSRLHRVGYTLCVRMARFARMIAPRALNAGETTLCVLEAVLGKRPFYPAILDNPQSTEMRAIESLADLRKIADYLSDLALRIAIADALGVKLDLPSSPELAQGPKLDDYVRTALLHQLSGRALSTSPILAEELATFRDLAHAGISDQQKALAGLSLTALLDDVGVVEARASLTRLITQWFSDLQESFSALPQDQDIDSKFLGGVISCEQKD
ncbi:MAG: hypothetical protein JKY56_00625 [Kofleriaceae bacterium]|nr:hypothetical protein [Kofleriaceae bacterium]